jgi:type VI secretion system protein ImpH
MIEELLGNGPAFSFIQAFRLLSRLIRKERGEMPDDLELSRRLRVRPELSLNFPGTDIIALEKLRDDPLSFRLTVCFLGLYGTSSPLPTFYTEDLLHEQSEDRSITRDFLDIIHTPLYPLLFRCWAKYRLAYQIAEERNPDFLERLYSLLGLSGDSFRSRFRDPKRLLRYTGLALQFPRSAEGLRAMLSDALSAPDIRVIQCVTRFAVIPEDQRFRVGINGNRLGQTSFLGFQIADHTGKFRVRADRATGDTLHRLLPDGEAFRDMTEIIGFYLDQPLEWDLEVALAPGRVHTAGLGTAQWSKLGWNTWIFSGPPPGEEMAVKLQM